MATEPYQDFLFALNSPVTRERYSKRLRSFFVFIGVEGTTMEERNKEIVRAFQDEIFNQKNLTALDRYYSADLVQHNPQQPQGREGAKQFFSMLFAAFPNLHAHIDKMVAENDLVMYMITWNATHQGGFFGIPPTNKTITFETAELFHLADNGTMVEHWDVVDRGIILDLMQE